MSTRSETRAGDQLPLKQYLAILWKNLWIILAVSIVTVSAAVYQTSQQAPTYTSEAQILVQPVSSALDGGNENQVNMATEIELARSERTAAIALESIGRTTPVGSLLSGLTVSNIPDTEILEFSYTAASPEAAYKGALALSEGYLQLRRDQAIDSLTASATSIRERLDDAQAELNRVNEQFLAASADENEARVDLLRPRVDALSGQVALLQQQLAALGAPNMLDVGQVIQPATAAFASTPNPARNGLIALLVGLLLGTGIAFLRDHLDERVQDSGLLESQVGAPMMAAIPTVGSWRKSKDAFLVSLRDPGSAAAEAFGTLRASLTFAASRRGLKIVMVTSPSQGEGKTSIAANIAWALARGGERVTAISADMRRPRLHLFFRADNLSGLVNVLIGQKKLMDCLVKPPGAPQGLLLLPSGPPPSNPAELLGSEAMAKLLEEASETSDFVVVDAPPLLPVADAIALAPLVESVLLVANAHSTTRSSLERATKRLQQLEAPIVGAVLNRSDSEPLSSYGFESYRLIRSVNEPPHHPMTASAGTNEH